MTTRTESPADLLEFTWIWNRLHGQDTPPVHRRILRWLQPASDAPRRQLLMAFRGCGKSTLVGLFCAWSLYRRPALRILVLAAEQSLAGKMVGHVRRIVERHPLCAALHPEGQEAWAADRFTVRRAAALRDPSMLAQGLGGNITGARADLVICDDVEVANNCDTPGKRAELRERLAETEFVLTPGGSLLYVGTPHTEESLYRSGDAFLHGYRRLEVPMLDQAGASAWPERFSEAGIAALRARVGPLHFARQMLLQPVAAGAARLDPALLIRYAEDAEYREANGRAQLWLLGRRMVSGGGFWDPAFGREGSGDGSVRAGTTCTASPGSPSAPTRRTTQRRSSAAPWPSWPASIICRWSAWRPTGWAVSCLPCSGASWRGWARPARWWSTPAAAPRPSASCPPSTRCWRRGGSARMTASSARPSPARWRSGGRKRGARATTRWTRPPAPSSPSRCGCPACRRASRLPGGADAFPAGLRRGFVGYPKDLASMPGTAGRGDGVAAIGAAFGQAHADEALQAGLVLQLRRAAMRLDQHQAVQRRAAAGFQIGLCPHHPITRHRPLVGRCSPGRKEVSWNRSLPPWRGGSTPSRRRSSPRCSG
jgi:hypothetical protein